MAQASVRSFMSSDDYRAFLRGELPSPFELYAEMRAEDPVHWAPELESWVLTRYADVRAVSQYDTRISSDRMTALLAPLGGGQGLEPLHDHLRSWLTFTDPPAHTVRRDQVKRHLTPAAVADFGPRVEQLVAQLLADMEAQEQPDLIRDLAYPLPAMVVCQLLGVPTSHLDPLRAWSNRVMRFIENVAEDKVAAAEDANEAVLEMTAFVRPLVEERRRSPKDDLISTLVPLVDDGQLSPTALYGWCLLILIAGHETTTGLIGNAVTTFLQHPEAMASLRAEPARIDRAIEEILRFESPVDRQTRLAIEDLELGGKRIPAGSRMYCLLAAANRDPEAFAEPETLDIDRWPNRHLGFGYGIHFCLGAYLARLEARTAVLEVLSRYPNLTLAGTPKRWRGQTMRRYESVPVDLRLEERQA